MPVLQSAARARELYYAVATFVEKGVFTDIGTFDVDVQ
jgi:hypothetical protein